MKLGQKTGWIGYLLYAVFLTVLLLYIRFPSESISAYLKSVLAATTPPLRLSLRALRPALPLNVELLDTEISLKNAPRPPVMTLKELSVRPKPLAFLLGEQAYSFWARAYQGTMRGKVRFRDGKGGGALSVSVQLKGIRIDRHPALSSMTGSKVSGTMEGHIQYAGEYPQAMDGSGDATVELFNGMVELPRPILGLQSLRFYRLSVTMNLKERRVTLLRGEVEGRGFKIRVSGTILLRGSIMASTLRLKGTMEFGNGLLKGQKGPPGSAELLGLGLKNLSQPFVIRGTLESPVFRFT